MNQMNKTLTDRRMSLAVVAVCFLTYSMLGLSRNAYSAAMVGIINDGVLSKTLAGTISSSYYVTYSLSQFFGSFYVDRISPFKIVAFGVTGTIIANLCMALFPTYEVILVARSACGLVQFGIWPAFLKITTEYICPEHREKSKYLMPLGITAGTVFSYLLAALVFEIGNWQDMFMIAGIILFLMLGAFAVTVVKANKRTEEVLPTVETDRKERPKASTGKNWALILSSGAILIFIFSLMNSLYATSLTWMPTIMVECYDLSPSFSSLMTTITTCASLTGIFWVFLIYPKRIKSQMTAMWTIAMAILPLATILVFTGVIPFLVALAAITLIKMLRAGIHHFLTVEIPAGYKKYNKAGMMAGMINVFACVGSMIGGTVYGIAADRMGWNMTILLGAVFVGISVLALGVAIPIWKRFVKK